MRSYLDKLLDREVSCNTHAGNGGTSGTGTKSEAGLAHVEETLSADLDNRVDNYRSLQPLTPRTFRYNITLPMQQELSDIGVTLKRPIHVHAQINYEHLTPNFARSPRAQRVPMGRPVTT